MTNEEPEKKPETIETPPPEIIKVEVLPDDYN